jgi:mono/diheme cytochrome c family protein
MRPLSLFVVFAIALGVSLTNLAMTGQANQSSTRSAAELYLKYCATCHGKDGQAKTLKGKLNNARNLTDPLWQDGTSDERLFNSIMNGKRKMPGFSKKLSEQEIDALVSYVRMLKRK